MNGKKVFVGLSGGVDSAVSAALLQKEGYEVTGVFIRIQITGYPCSAKEDRLEAMRVAAHLKIPFLEIDLSEEYEEEVFKHAIGEFARGRTPNPDTLCNREIKFGKFFEFARSRGADFVATGHYAQVEEKEGEFHLLAGKDENKDQSYFLWAVPETHLRHTLFPVGNLKKSRVRALAKKFGLPNAERKDSQGLCFLGPIGLEDMIAREIPQKPGAVLNEDGKKIGTHKGAAHYTMGQRHGFELVAQTPHTPPHFVVGKDMELNTITVSIEQFPKTKQKTALFLRDTNWIGTLSAGACLARYRFRQKLIPAEVPFDSAKMRVVLLEPHIVPEGQSLVLYRGERCLGGGTIESATLVG